MTGQVEERRQVGEEDAGGRGMWPFGDAGVILVLPAPVGHVTGVPSSSGSSFPLGRPVV